MRELGPNESLGGLNLVVRRLNRRNVSDQAVVLRMKSLEHFPLCRNTTCREWLSVVWSKTQTC